jgi:hypothetical protein
MPPKLPKRFSAMRTSLDSIGNKKPAASMRTAGSLMSLNTQGRCSGGGGGIRIDRCDPRGYWLPARPTLRYTLTHTLIQLSRNKT